MKNVPEIRFKGTASIWEYKNFSYFIERVSMSRKAGEIPGIEYEDIISGEGVFNKNIFTKKCDKKGVLFVNGDILFGKLRPYLKKIILATFEGVAIGDFWIFRSKDVDCRCVYYLVNSNSFMKIANISSGSKMPRADWNLISGTKFNFPKDTTEQKNIGTFFYELDRNIYSSKSRLASLKQLKSACLISMFPQQGETVPRVRFKGFDGEWKICELKQFAFKVTRKNCDKEFTKTFTNSAEFGVINQNEYFDRTISNSENIGGYYVVENNDYIYNPRVSTLAPVGPINRNKLGYTGVVSPLYLVFKANNIDKDYLDVFFNTNLWHRYMKLEGNCGARFDRLSISDELFFEMPIILPSNEAEQRQIASYFRQLDIQISEQEKRLEKLKQIKAACLDKMFV